MTNPWWLQAILSSLPAIIASSGFWAYVHKKETKRTATSKLLMGLAYEKIVTLGMLHIARGSISEDEYSDFVTYFYQPYKDVGGNGVALRIMEEVSRLPLRNPPPPPQPRLVQRGKRAKEFK